VVPGYSRPAGAVTHRRQRVVHGLLLRMSLESQIAAVGGVEPRATHQFLFKPVLNENCHGVAESEAGHSLQSQYQVENYALASQALNDSGPRESPLWTRNHNINTPAPGTFMFLLAPIYSSEHTSEIFEVWQRDDDSSQTS